MAAGSQKCTGTIAAAENRAIGQRRRRFLPDDARCGEAAGFARRFSPFWREAACLLDSAAALC